MDLSCFVDNVNLLDFYNRKSNEPLVNIDFILNTFSKHDKSSYLPSNESKKMGELIKYNCSIIYKVLVIGNGKISLCGNSIARILEPLLIQKKYCTIKQFNLYIHSCTIIEAKELIIKSLDILGGNIYCNEDHILVWINNISIKLFVRIYNNRLEILNNNGPITERHGWDPIQDYFGTTSSAVLIINKIFPVSTFYSGTLVFYDVINSGLNDNYYTLTTSHKSVRYGILGSVQIIQTESPSLCNELSVNNTVDLALTDDYVKTFVKASIPKINSRVYLGLNYITKNVGINNERYVAFRNCQTKFLINSDLFNLICYYWLQAEASLSQERLLNTN